MHVTNTVNWKVVEGTTYEVSEHGDVKSSNRVSSIADECMSCQ